MNKNVKLLYKIIYYIKHIKIIDSFLSINKDDLTFLFLFDYMIN